MILWEILCFVLRRMHLNVILLKRKHAETIQKIGIINDVTIVIVLTFFLTNFNMRMKSR